LADGNMLSPRPLGDLQRPLKGTGLWSIDGRSVDKSSRQAILATGLV
jgi:hypothetical protein